VNQVTLNSGRKEDATASCSIWVRLMWPLLAAVCEDFAGALGPATGMAQAIAQTVECLACERDFEVSPPGPIVWATSDIEPINPVSR